MGLFDKLRRGEASQVVGLLDLVREVDQRHEDRDRPQDLADGTDRIPVHILRPT